VEEWSTLFGGALPIEGAGSSGHPGRRGVLVKYSFIKLVRPDDIPRDTSPLNPFCFKGRRHECGEISTLSSFLSQHLFFARGREFLAKAAMWSLSDPRDFVTGNSVVEGGALPAKQEKRLRENTRRSPHQLAHEADGGKGHRQGRKVGDPANEKFTGTHRGSST